MSSEDTADRDRLRLGCGGIRGGRGGCVDAADAKGGCGGIGVSGISAEELRMLGFSAIAAASVISVEPEASSVTTAPVSVRLVESTDEPELRLTEAVL